MMRTILVEVVPSFLAFDDDDNDDNDDNDDKVNDQQT